MAKLAFVMVFALLGAVAAQAQHSLTSPSASPQGSPPPSSAPKPSPPSPSPQSPTTPPSQSPQSPSPAGLRVGFYKHSCPRAEAIVCSESGTPPPPTPASAQASSACDASVLLDPTAANPQPEKLSPPNFPSLRGFEVIDAALEKACPGVVSCADTLAFAARDASVFLSDGRVSFKVPAGRRDGRVSLSSEALAFLPPPSFNLSQLVGSFRAKGLGVEDMVVLSGAHTIGRSHCSSFSDRLSPSSGMNPRLAASLQRQCATGPNSTVDPTVVQDVVTPNRMDNQYYRNVLNRKALFDSDAALLTSFPTKLQVVFNAIVPGLWEHKFEAAMVKMASIEVKTGNNGEIRTNCRVVN